MTATDDVLSAEAIEFLHLLQREFGAERTERLAQRQTRAERLRSGEIPDFLDETLSVREADWTVPPAPHDLVDRRVEITGPTDRKMVINALNSGARVFLSDFEDANSPTWENIINGQRNLSDAIDRTIELETPEKKYKLKDEVATLMVRPRGWHLLERHFKVDGEQISSSLFDFGLYLFRNHGKLRAAGTGPYFYLPKLESRHEAGLWMMTTQKHVNSSSGWRFQRTSLSSSRCQRTRS
jgi:malate synthase